MGIDLVGSCLSLAAKDFGFSLAAKDFGFAAFEAGHAKVVCGGLDG